MIYVIDFRLQQPSVGESPDWEKEPNLNMVIHEHPISLEYMYKVLEYSCAFYEYMH